MRCCPALSGFVFSISLVTSGFAQLRQLPPPQQRFAILMGISEYKSLPSLSFATNDVNAMRDVVIGRLGFPAENVLVISSGQPTWGAQGTRGTAFSGLYEELLSLPPDSLLLFYYSGYGFQSGSDAYLVPSDAIAPRGAYSQDSLELFRQTSISVRDLERWIARSKASAAILMFDACLLDPFGDAPKANQSFAPGFGLSDPGQGTSLKSFALITSAGFGESAYVDTQTRLGIFTEEVVRGLSGAAAEQGANFVTLGGLLSYLVKQVPSHSLALTGDSRVQRPYAQIVGFNADQLILTPVADDGSLAAAPFFVSATIHASGDSSEQISKRFHFDDRSDDCAIDQDRDAQFCFTEADGIDAWDPPIVANASCPKDGSFVREVTKSQSDPRCVNTRYHLRACGFTPKRARGKRACKGTASLAFDLPVRGKRSSPRRLEDYEMRVTVGSSNSVRQFISYPIAFRSGAENIRFTYDVDVSRPDVQLRTRATVHLTDSTPEFSGVRTSMSDDGQLLIDLTEAANRMNPAR